MKIEGLNGRLFAPYQRDGVKWMLGMEAQTSGPKGGFLSDEMGLGKTVQLISTMLANPKDRTLIPLLWLEKEVLVYFTRI